MKFKHYIRYLIPELLIIIMFINFIVILSADTVHSRQNLDSVVLVPLHFENEKWSLGGGVVNVLPCAAPTKFIRGTEKDPYFNVLGPKGEILYNRQMRNPRLILIEDPEKEPPLLSKVSFALRFPLTAGMEFMEFWYDPATQKEPSIRVDLRNAILRYWKEGGPYQEAPCQPPAYIPGLFPPEK